MVHPCANVLETKTLVEKRYSNFQTFIVSPWTPPEAEKQVERYSNLRTIKR